MLFLCKQTVVRMDWIIPQWICHWRTTQVSWWMVLRGPMMASSSAATATMPPEAPHGSLSTSESTQVSLNYMFVRAYPDEILIFSFFFFLIKQERNLTAATSAHLRQPTSVIWRPTCDHTQGRSLTNVSCARSAAVIVATCRTIVADDTNSCR